ncbi:hypothetical protein KCG48_10820 [Proteiniclasticum sp. BAD-10]|uniref:Lipoprotein n=1 Tax=Proteiniclasticum sediminis TaxID=2804028 RepID=A0A941HS11_9CLOT|nr:hypothetical protein [Proteiniclasticum sediminis]MBR0576822.1 hypothetical protein [Proteiniclasticum sediminis]
MKKTISIIVACIMIILVVGCSKDTTDRTGQVKTPSTSSAQEGNDYLEVIELFEKNGFTNIKVEKVEDLITGWLTKDGEVESVSIGGDVKYSEGEWFPMDIEVIISYHTFPRQNSDAETPSEEPGKEDPSTEEALAEALEAVFPVVNAQRAAVVLFTNYFATDVFAPDGNTYDVTKFHRYEDTSGNFYKYYLRVIYTGDWTPKDKQSWHVEKIMLEHSFGNELIASLDVTYDGVNMIISNISGTFGKNVDLSEIETSSNASIFTTVSPEMIKNDRAQTKIDSHHDWVNGQFGIFDGSHKNLVKLIKKNLNDESSFDHIETSFVEISEEAIRDDLNQRLKATNIDATVEIGDLWIETQFSAKNAFNATVKKTAYGIASFTNDTVTLVSIN